MKKLAAVTLATCTVLAACTVLTGCGTSVRTTASAPRTGAKVVAITKPDAAAACNPKASSLAPQGPPRVTAGSYMATIKARGYLIAGVDQSTYHFGFLNPLNKQIEGFDIDMIHAVANAIFGNPDAVKFKAITDAQRIPDILNGSVDIVAHTMTITCARLQQVDFSSVYFDAGQRVLVQDDSAATSLAGLKGQNVCATAGSDSLSVIKQAGAVPVPVAYWTDCLVLLQQDRVAAVSTDDAILAGLAAQDPFTKLVGPRLTDEPYGLAMSKQHPDFVRFVNGVLAQLRSDGQWAASYRHWVGTPAATPPVAHYAG